MTALFRMEGVTKRYGGVRALEDAHLECGAGRIHAVLGENGAGKSTLIEVMAGVVRPDAGTMELAGVPVHLRRTRGRDPGPGSSASSRSSRCSPT